MKNLLLGKYTQIERGTVEEGKKQMAFIIPFCKEGRPYENYEQENLRGVILPSVLTVARWDGFMGNAGGFVEEGETPLEGAMRELHEELGVPMEKIDIDKIKPLRTFASKGSNIHSFTYECTWEGIKEIKKWSDNAPHLFSEISGSNVWQLFSNGKKNSYQNLLNQNWSATAGIEIQALVEDYKLMEVK